MTFRSIFRPDLFAGRSIVVTGGGSGIGRCTAHELAALGARVALVGRTPEKLDTVRAEIGGDAATTHACDIRDEDKVQETVAAIHAAHGRIDGLVNNAGGQYPAPLASITAKGWDAVVRNNLTGGFLMARECYTQAMAGHGGTIVNIIADMWHGMPGMGHSGAARAGMLNFTETAACEWAVSGSGSTPWHPVISPPPGSTPTRPSSSSRRENCRARCRCNASASTPRSRRRSSSCCRRRQVTSPARSSASTAASRTPARPGPCPRTTGHGPSMVRKGRIRARPLQNGHMCGPFRDT